MQSLRTTKDYLDQIIRSSRLTFADIGEEEDENKEFSNIEEFIQYWSEQKIEENTLKNLEYFVTRFNRVLQTRLRSNTSKTECTSMQSVIVVEKRLFVAYKFTLVV